MMVWLLFDPNDYKDDLAALVEERTGRSFVIEDDLGLTFFPWLGVQTGGVRLGNAEGFGEEDFASTAAVTVRVRLLPLLSRRLEIGTVELEGLELNLARDEEGRGNWEDLLVSASAESTETESTPSTGSVVQDLDIAGINIRNGIIFWREDVTEVQYVLSELSLDTGPIAIGQPVDAALDFQLVGVDPPFTARLGARTTALIDPDTLRYEARDLELEFRVEDGQHDERATGRLAASIEYSGEDASIQISAAELEAELTNPPVGPEELSFQAASPQARLDMETQTAELQGLTTTIGDIVARWELTGARLLDDPELTGTVSIAGAALEDALDVVGLELETEGDLGSFDLSSGFTVEPATGALALNDLRGSALGVAFIGEIVVNERETTGRIDAPAFDPATLLGALPQGTIEGANVAGVDSLALSAAFSVNGTNQVFSLRDVTVSIPGATFTGAVDRLEDGSRLRGRIATTDVAPDVFLTLFPDRLPEGLGPDRLGTMSIDTSFDYDVTGDSLQLDDLSARALGLHTTGGLVVQELSGSPRMTGDLEVQQFSPRALFDRFDQTVPVTSDSTALSVTTISAAVDVNEGRGLFEGIRMRLDDTTVTGRFTVENFDDPKYIFDLALDRVDVDRYLAPAGGDTAPEDLDGPAAGDLPLPTEPLHALTLEGRASVADLRMAGLNFTNVSTDILIEDGIGRVDSARAQLYGGDFEGGLELDARAGGPSLSLKGSAVSIGLGPLMTDLSGQSTLSGTGTFDLELSGTGQSLNDALATAAGHVDFSLRDGAIQGFNLNHTLCDAYNRLKNYPRPAPTDVSFTTFNLLRGTTQVSEGIARTNDLVAEAPSLEVTGRGQMDLVSKGINYDLEAKMTSAIPIPRCDTLDSGVGNSIPLEVSGTATEPVILPDFGELVRREVRDELQDRLLEKLFGN